MVIANTVLYICYITLNLRMSYYRRFDLDIMTAPPDFREPSSIANVNPKILDSDNMGPVVNYISHCNANVDKNTDNHKLICKYEHITLQT